MEPNPLACERCFHPLSEGQHGLGVCPLEFRPAGFHTPQDKLYEFTTGDGTEVRTRLGWERFKRARNLVDLPLKENINLSTGGFRERKRCERMDKLKRELAPILGSALQASRG